MSAKIKCVIVEDEQHNMRLIEDYISKVEDLELIGTFISPVELLNFEKLAQVQLMYLDIQTPGMTGIDFLKTIPVDAEVIFTTAYSEYALKGYELNITDYLLKPVELPRFIQATQKAIANINRNRTNQANLRPSHVMLKVDKKLVKVLVDDIVYIQSDWNYVHIHTTTNKLVVLSTMKDIEEMFAGHNFIRIHKSFIVNLGHFEFMEGNMIQVNGVKLQVSRSYKNDVLEALQA